MSLAAVAGLAEAIDPREQIVGARTVQLEQRLRVLESDENAKYVAGALEQARRALDQARGPDLAHSQRAQSIADAALALADRQLARRRAQAALLQTERRLRQVRERADAQRRVLEALMRERAALSQRESP